MTPSGSGRADPSTASNTSRSCVANGRIRPMEGVAALFDTNILIDYLSGVEAAKQALTRHRNRAISVITWTEVMVGVTEQDAQQTRAFLATFVLHPINDQVAERAVTLRRESRLKLPDAIILATAELTDRRLITRNTRDFSEEDPRVHIPYRL